MPPIAPKTRPPDGATILFDGDCALCSRLVRFLRKRDTRSCFRYAPLTSEAGTQLLQKYHITDRDTVVLIEGERAFTRSTAALRIASHLDWPWKLLAALQVIPAFVRDPLYMVLARHRYRWFGRRTHCELPPPDLKERCQK